MMQGSCWTSSGGRQIGLVLSINGTKEITSTIFANPASQHLATVMKMEEYKFPLNITNGVINPVQVTISVLDANTNFDRNDTVVVAIMGKSE